MFKLFAALSLVALGSAVAWVRTSGATTSVQVGDNPAGVPPKAQPRQAGKSVTLVGAAPYGGIVVPLALSGKGWAGQSGPVYATLSVDYPNPPGLWLLVYVDLGKESVQGQPSLPVSGGEAGILSLPLPGGKWWAGRALVN